MNLFVRFIDVIPKAATTDLKKKAFFFFFLDQWLQRERNSLS